MEKEMAVKSEAPIKKASLELGDWLNQIEVALTSVEANTESVRAPLGEPHATDSVPRPPAGESDLYHTLKAYSGRAERVLDRLHRILSSLEV